MNYVGRLSMPYLLPATPHKLQVFKKLITVCIYLISYCGSRAIYYCFALCIDIEDKYVNIDTDPNDGTPLIWLLLQPLPSEIATSLYIYMFPYLNL